MFAHPCWNPTRAAGFPEVGCREAGAIDRVVRSTVAARLAEAAELAQEPLSQMARNKAVASPVAGSPAAVDSVVLRAVGRPAKA